MTPAVLHVLLFAACPVVDLDRLTPAAARELTGRPCWVTFLPVGPADTVRGVTVVGAAEQPDGVSRTAVLKGERFDVKEGRRLTVRATVRVIDHPPAFVNGVFVPGWTEVRAEG